MKTIIDTKLSGVGGFMKEKTKTYLSSNCWMSEWLSDVHSSKNEVGSVPCARESNFANPAFPTKIDYKY